VGLKLGADDYLTKPFDMGAYWYHQNDALNVASWTHKRTLGQDISYPAMRRRIQEPELKDNRFGFNFGGPYPWWENTFFFLNYEGRRFPHSSEFTRLVPTDTLKQSILRFRDDATVLFEMIPDVVSI